MSNKTVEMDGVAVKEPAFQPSWVDAQGNPITEHIEAGLNLAAECHKHAMAARLGFVGKT